MSVPDVLESWRSLAAHAASCDRCLKTVALLAPVPDDPGRADAAAHEVLCGEGGGLFVAWWEAKHAMLELTLELRRRQFLTSAQLWDDGVTFATRARAIMSMPGPEFSAWLKLPDDRRRAQLRAIESASTDVRERPVELDASTGLGERPATTTESTDLLAPRRCPVDLREFRPRGERQVYCSDACRKKAHSARLVETE